MSDAIPPSYPVTVTVEETRKGILRSKTFWLQVLAFLSVLFPPVQSWLASNPVEAVALLAALNVLVRFATSGRVTIFSANENAGSEAAGGPLSLLMVCTVAGLSFGLALPSCSPAEYPVAIGIQGPGGSVSYSSAGGLRVDAVIHGDK